MEPKRITFNLSPEEVKLVAQIKKKLEPRDGVLTNVAVVRKALRAFAVQEEAA
jgi:hypothetical protein